MRVLDIISKKKNGQELSTEEIQFFITGMVKNEIPDYQVASLLMAIYFRGMNEKETLELTKAMLYSGDVIDLSAIPGIKVDKHSTGGVGDKTTIVLAPLVASAGAPVAKMSGRGLGHTGGTIDKLDSFDNINVELSIDQFIKNVQSIGIAVSGQSANLVPADKKLYALRDVTATVDSIPLIAGSIMSKKLASGSDAIVLDVKAGSGAFMKDTEQAFELARELVKIGEGMGRSTVALISQMDQPLGNAIGNTIEVREAIETLKGNGPEDLVDICLELGSHMLVLAKVANSKEEAKEILQEKLTSGAALKKLKQMIQMQNGDPAFVDDMSLLPSAKYAKELVSTQSGNIEWLDARTVGVASMLLGAGRKTKEDQIDLAAGIFLHKKVGDNIKEGMTLATLYSNTESSFENAIETLSSAYKITNTTATKLPLVYGTITKADLKTKENV